MTKKSYPALIWKNGRAEQSEETDWWIRGFHPRYIPMDANLFFGRSNKWHKVVFEDYVSKEDILADVQLEFLATIQLTHRVNKNNMLLHIPQVGMSDSEYTATVADSAVTRTYDRLSRAYYKWAGNSPLSGSETILHDYLSADLKYGFRYDGKPIRTISNSDMMYSYSKWIEHFQYHDMPRNFDDVLTILNPYETDIRITDNAMRMRTCPVCCQHDKAHLFFHSGKWSSKCYGRKHKCWGNIRTTQNRPSSKHGLELFLAANSQFPV